MCITAHRKHFNSASVHEPHKSCKLIKLTGCDEEGTRVDEDGQIQKKFLQQSTLHQLSVGQSWAAGGIELGAPKVPVQLQYHVTKAMPQNKHAQKVNS